MPRILPAALLCAALAGCAASGPLARTAGGCDWATALRLSLAGLPCAAAKPPPAPYCTRSLADVDCWADPADLPDHQRQVAAGGWEAPVPRAPQARTRAPAPYTPY